MKKGMKVLSLCLFVVGVLLLGGSVLVFAQKPAVGWRVSYTNPDTKEPIEGTEAFLSTDSHTGKYSAYVKTTSRDRKKASWCQGWSYPITSLLKPNSKYVLSGWIKTNLIGRTDVQFACYLYERQPYTSDNFRGYATNMKGVNNWTYKKIVIETPNEIANANIHFLVHSEGEAWVDDVSLIDVSTGKNLLENPGFEIIEEGSIEEPIV